MIYFIRSFTTTFILLLLVTSCGESRNGNLRSPASLGEEFSVEIASLSQTEVELGLRVCNALRSKRTYWHTQPILGKKATIKYYEKDCEADTDVIIDEEITATIAAPLMSKPIIFDSLSAVDFFVDVLTDYHGPLETVCPTILAGEAPLAFFASGEDRVYLDFSKIDDNTHGLTLKYAEVTSNDQQKLSGYKVYKIVNYDIVTSGSDSTYHGTVKQIDEVGSCENEGELFKAKQSLISIH